MDEKDEYFGWVTVLSSTVEGFEMYMDEREKSAKRVTVLGSTMEGVKSASCLV